VKHARPALHGHGSDRQAVVHKLQIIDTHRSKDALLATPRTAEPGSVPGNGDGSVSAVLASGEQKLGREPLLRSKEAADLLLVHYKTLERKARHGQIPGHFRNGRWHFFASELDGWLRSAVHLASQSVRVNEVEI